MPREFSELKVEGVVERIDVAPDAVAHKNQPRSRVYHRKVSGDGSQIEHYEQRETSDGLQWKKDERNKQVDQKTISLLREGAFVFDGYQFSLDSKMREYVTQLMVAAREKALSFPVKLNTANSRHQYQFDRWWQLRKFYKQYFSVFHQIFQSGEDLKEQIAQETTLDGINSILDERTVENTKFIYPEDFFTREYDSKKRISKISAWGTDNGDGTYSDLAYEDTFNYSNGRYGVLESIVRQYYWNDGTEAGEPEEVKLYENSDGVEIIKGTLPPAQPF
jgi:hypothetical protein